MVKMYPHEGSVTPISVISNIIEMAIEDVGCKEHAKKRIKSCSKKSSSADEAWPEIKSKLTNNG